MATEEVRTRASECLNQFRLLLEIELQVQEGGRALSFSNLKTDDQIARFEIWAGNIGAFADGHASLDYRLRDSEDARVLMNNFLDSLSDFIRRATEALKQNSSQDDGEIRMAQENFQESPVDAFLESDSSAISSSFQGTESDSIPEFTLRNPFEQRLQGIERSIDRLYRLSLLIRQPSLTSQNNKAERIKILDEEGNDIDDTFVDYAFRFITHRFPEAPELLRHRLAKGITVRRKRFLYRQSHQRKLSAKTVFVPAKSQYAASNLDETVRGVKLQIENRVHSTEIPPRAGANRVLSQTSASALTKRHVPYEEKVDEDAVSRPSTMFTKATVGEGPIAIPEPPKPGPSSKEFECPYCCIILPMNQAKASQWRRHVLGDLEPYTCVFEHCTEHETLFQDRRSWVSHMQHAHTSRWICSYTSHAPMTFENEGDYEEHMWVKHKGTFTASQLPFLKKRNKSIATVLFEQCPLCGYRPPELETKYEYSNSTPDESLKDRAKVVSDRITKHLAGHLEILSVRALPWQDLPADPEKESTVSKHAEEGTRLGEADSSLAPDDNASRLSVASDDIPQEEATGSGEESLLKVDQSDVSYEEEWGFIALPDYHGHDRDPTLQTLLRKLYLETSVTPGRRRGPALPAYSVPVDRDKNFVGRDFPLNAMREVLCHKGKVSSGNSKPLTFPRCYTIYGAGGLGKTQVAAQFVTTHRKEFDAILWVHAKNSLQIAKDFKNIAIALELVSEDSVDASDLSYTRDVVIRWLVNPLKNMANADLQPQETASWLLVFDGVEDPNVLNSFWPYDGPGSILITSRSPYSWSTSLPLKPFSMAEATAYLLQVTGRTPDEDEKYAVAALAKRLGGLPLALAQMGAFIAHKKMSFGQFTRSYEEKEGQQRLLQWSLSDSRLQSSESERNIASIWALDSLAYGAELLNILSMLDPDGIPENIFIDTTANLEPIKAHSNEKYKEARNELFARSLVTGNKREQKLFIHRIVQDVARSRMRQTDLRKTFFSCVRLLSARWPFEDFAWRHGIARYHHERGNSADAILFNNMAQSICESLKLRLIEHPELLSKGTVTLERLSHTLSEITHSRGCTALEINEPEDALKYHKLFNDMMLKEFSSTPPKNDIRLAKSWNELGNAYMLSQNWAKGEESFVKSIEEMRKLDNFREVLVSLPVVNLGQAHWLQNKHDEAEATLLKGLRDREAEFGVDDRISFATGRFLHALGNIKDSRGLLDEGLDYHRRALLHYKSTLGNRHHRTADLFVKVADHNIRLYQYEMALALLDHALETYTYTNNYLPEKTRASFKRVKALHALRRSEEADSELSRCFEVYNQLFQEQLPTRSVQASRPKKTAADLVDNDFDELIVFWSK
ncbi:MAG: hypothetical protein Q9160_002214 [Pyrenula sp. 1 TL-2023]